MLTAHRCRVIDVVELARVPNFNERCESLGALRDLWRDPLQNRSQWIVGHAVAPAACVLERHKTHVDLIPCFPLACVVVEDYP